MNQNFRRQISHFNFHVMPRAGAAFDLPRENVPFPAKTRAKLAERRMTGRSRIFAVASVLLTLLTCFTDIPSAPAQEVAAKPKEQFIPFDQLDTVFDRDRRGVMMKREEFKALLAKARDNATENIPIPIIGEGSVFYEASKILLN